MKSKILSRRENLPHLLNANSRKLANINVKYSTFRLPKETDAETRKNNGSEGVLMDVSAVINTDHIMESIDQQALACTDDSPKLDQYLLESIAAAVTSSSTSVTATNGFQNFGGNSAQSSQNTSDNPEMPQLMSILNELLDGQDLSSLANTGGNGDNMQDMEDQEENYEDDSPRKDDPDEMSRLLVLQRLEEISREEQQLQRKMDFMIRRLYKLVARSTGLHASEEIAGFLEHVARHNKTKENQLKEEQLKSLHIQEVDALSELPVNLLSSPSTSQPQIVVEAEVDEPPKPVLLSEMKSFLKRIENLATMQSTIVNKRAHAIKYFTNPSPNSQDAFTKTDNNLFKNSIPRFDERDLNQLDQVSGLLMTEMRLIGKQIDSDETASSSGGESADEMVPYNNHYQQPLSM